MTRRFEVDDLYLHRKITELDCAAGAVAACTVRSVQRESDDYMTAIWRYELDSGAARQITHGPGNDHTPKWSPRGNRLAFISDRSGTTQVHLMDMEGGEASQLGAFEGAVSAIRWAPDAKSLVVAAAVEVDPDWRGQRSNGRRPRERSAASAEVCWRLPYKSDGMGYLLAREIHLFRLDATNGEAAQLTDGQYDVVGYDISPDGGLAYTRTRSGRFGHATDLWTCAADGSQARQLTHGLAMVEQPQWAPDGQRIAFCGAVREGDAQANLWLVDAASGELTRLCDDSLCVADPETLRWTSDGKALLFSRAMRGRHQIVRLDVASGSIDVLVSGDVQFGAFGVTDGHFAYTAEHPARPCELFTCKADGSGQRQVSRLNAWWKERTRIQAQARVFVVPDGKGGTEEIEGWLLRAEGASGPLPLHDDVHGGPASYVLLDFDTNVFWQVLCSRGWAILALNAVGSASYGREVCDRLEGHWGEFDLPQHLSAIRQLRGEGVCDDRVTICGKSYGGYLSAWAIGHCEDFRAAVVMSPVGNIETHYGTSDGGYYADPLYMGCEGAFDRKLARELSPVQAIERTRTPTLFMQGKEDERCPTCQSEELFVSLMRAGDTPAELVLYPDEGHSFLGSGKPSVRADAATRIVDWLSRFVAGPSQK